MAEVIGFLRDEATFGEKETLKYLRTNLPKEFSIYVETPIHKKRDIVYPDFIVLTSYGVVVLEVKDWVQIEGRATPHSATVRNRSGQSRLEHNPVNQARDHAIALSLELKSRLPWNSGEKPVPWSYAVILFNLPSSVISQLRTAWGQTFVLGKADLEIPNVLQKRIRETMAADRMRPLTRLELDNVRATIYPVVEIQPEGREPFVLDQQQEKIVAEPVREDLSTPSAKEQRKISSRRQEKLFESLHSKENDQTLPEHGEKLSKNVAIKLIRGFSGSGKTLVLIQRAKFLAAQFPEWKIGVFSYNKPLQEQLQRDLSGTNIEVRTFHGKCRAMLRVGGDAFELEDWLNEHKKEFPIVKTIGAEIIKSEIEWMQDMALQNLDAYLKIERHGVGAEKRLSKEQREKIFNVLEMYRLDIRKQNGWDWHELPLIVLKVLEGLNPPPPLYDAILIDEAQDWAPAWFQVTNQLLNPDHGLLFLADDPSQSIFRNFSWREKGVNVVGRTRWLKVPYRNTFEIYNAAYSLIADNDTIQASLADEGELVRPEITSAEMRHGHKPVIHKFSSVQDELLFIKSRVEVLRREGLRDNQVAILTRHRNDMEPIQEIMSGYDVKLNPIHSFKGLEMEAVFIPHLQKTFSSEDVDAQDAERRLMYMAMTRARSQLYLTYSGKLPRVYNGLREKDLVDFL